MATKTKKEKEINILDIRMSSEDMSGYIDNIIRAVFDSDDDYEAKDEVERYVRQILDANQGQQVVEQMRRKYVLPKKKVTNG